MSAVMTADKPTLVGITIKFTPAEHEALKAVVFNDGYSSFQTFFRSLGVQKIREAELRQREGLLLAPSALDTEGGG
jgi:hypothetical protein